MNSIYIIMKITSVIMSILGVVSGQKVGGSLDHGCVLDGGYTWCESSNNCVRSVPVLIIIKIVKIV